MQPPQLTPVKSFATESTESTKSFWENLRGKNFFSVLTRFPTASLFLFDGLANVIDFVFHFWMGRVLTPAEFAVLQTINSIVLVYATASGVFQPVVGRFVAEARAKGDESSVAAIFQSFFRAAFWLGLGLSLIALTFSNMLAGWINAPLKLNP